MENSQLTIADLASVKNLLDAACTRGAFRANEMSAVGQIYDKLASFLDAAQQAQTEEAQGETNA